MSSEQKNQSKKGQDEQAIVSVFDFLYHDARRIASFLSQFDAAGYLKEIVLGQSVERAKQRSGIAKASGGVPAVLLAGGEHSTETSASYEDKSQRIYDPVWANALSFLDLLDEKNMINKDISSANMGQFVLCSGSLSMTDLKLMERIWKLSSVQALMKLSQSEPGNRKQRRAKGKPISNSTNEIDLVIDLLGVLPHTIQAKISGNQNIWCSLTEDGMSTLPSDITLKHGTSIPGIWHVLGILDAKPEIRIDLEQEPDLSDGQELAAKVMTMLGPVAQNFLGRPEDHYGITPLLIFRRVAL